MTKLRYPEKKYLSKYDLSQEFFENLNIKVLDVIPLRKVFILKTETGKKILSKLHQSGGAGYDKARTSDAKANRSGNRSDTGNCLRRVAQFSGL